MPLDTEEGFLELKLKKFTAIIWFILRGFIPVLPVFLPKSSDNQ
jgi:hypothetical protein